MPEQRPEPPACRGWPMWERGLGVFRYHGTNSPRLTCRSTRRTAFSSTTTRTRISVRPDGREADPALSDVDGADRRRHDQDADGVGKPACLYWTFGANITGNGDVTTTTARSKIRSILFGFVWKNNPGLNDRINGDKYYDQTSPPATMEDLADRNYRESGKVGNVRLSFEHSSGRRECGVLRRGR